MKYLGYFPALKPDEVRFTIIMENFSIHLILMHFSWFLEQVFLFVMLQLRLKKYFLCPKTDSCINFLRLKSEWHKQGKLKRYGRIVALNKDANSCGFF